TIAKIDRSERKFTSCRSMDDRRAHAGGSFRPPPRPASPPRPAGDGGFGAARLMPWTGVAGSADHGRAPLEPGERARAVLAHQHIVLDAHADVAGAVEAGLEGEDDARLHPLRVADHHLRRLVDLEPEAVAGLVDDEV